jgi:peroxiredoxin
MSTLPQPSGLAPTGPLPPGTPAPDFRLPSALGLQVSLADFRGQRVVLVFYRGDWCPVSSEQLAQCQEFLAEIRRFGAELLGISVDSTWSHRAFADEHRLEFPLLSDFEPKGAIARAYGAYREQDGTCARTLFVIDEVGLVRWSYVAPVSVNPGVDGILTALENTHLSGRA